MYNGGRQFNKDDSLIKTVNMILTNGKHLVVMGKGIF